MYENEISVALERYIFSGEDVEYRTDEFYNGSINILYITGLSGSGKSTMARDIAASYDAEIFELDRIEHYRDYINREPYNLCEELLKKHLIQRHERRAAKDMSGDEFHKFFMDCFYYLLDYAKKHPKQKFIFEGIQIVGHLHDEDCLWDGAIIVKGTSALDSIQRRKQRDQKFILNGKERSIIQIGKWYANAEKYLNMFRNEVKRRKAKG